MPIASSRRGVAVAARSCCPGRGWPLSASAKGGHHMEHPFARDLGGCGSSWRGLSSTRRAALLAALALVALLASRHGPLNSAASGRTPSKRGKLKTPLARLSGRFWPGPDSDGTASLPQVSGRCGWTAPQVCMHEWLGRMAEVVGLPHKQSARAQRAPRAPKHHLSVCHGTLTTGSPLLAPLIHGTAADELAWSATSATFCCPMHAWYCS